MTSEQQAHVEGEVQAPSKDISRRPVHPRIKDGHESGQKGRLQRRAAVAQAVGRARSRDQARSRRQHILLKGLEARQALPGVKRLVC